MATGCDRTSLDNEDNDSEDFFCTPCSQEYKTVEAEKYCQTCLQNFCLECLQQHSRFNGMKDHILSEKKHTRSVHVESLRYKCKTHTNMSLEIYCQDCKQLSCSIGAATDHRNCSFVEYFPPMVMNISERSDFKDFKESLYTVKEQLEVIERSKKLYGEQIDVRATEVEEMITNYRDHLNSIFDDIEAKARHGNQQRHNKLSERIQKSVTTIQDKLEQVKEEIDTIEENISNEVTTFTNMKRAKQLIEILEKFIKDVHSAQKEEHGFEINTQIRELLSTVDSLGHFPRRHNMNKKLEVGKDTIVYIKNNDHFFLANKGNKIHMEHHLVKLDKDLNILNMLQLDDIPHGLCTVSNISIAVTLPEKKRILIIAIQDKLAITQQIDLDNRPHGIGCIQDELFVITHKHTILNTTKQIIRYNVVQNSSQTIKAVGEDEMSIDHPRAIATDQENELIYILDDKKGVIVNDQEGRYLTTISHPDLKSPKAMCVGNSGTLYLADTNAIYMASPNGETLTLLLDESYEIKCPTSICFDDENYRLHVAEKERSIKIFDIN